MGDVETGLAQAAKTVSAHLQDRPTCFTARPGRTTRSQTSRPPGRRSTTSAARNYGLAAQGVAAAIGLPPAQCAGDLVSGIELLRRPQHRPGLPDGSSGAVKGRRKAGARPVHALGRHGIRQLRRCRGDRCPRRRRCERKDHRVRLRRVQPAGRRSAPLCHQHRRRLPDSEPQGRGQHGAEVLHDRAVALTDGPRACVCDRADRSTSWPTRPAAIRSSSGGGT